MSHEATWEAYAAAWRTTNPAERAQLFESALQSDCTYTDPTIQAHGWDALVAYMDQFQQMLPGGGFETKAFRAHHDRCHVEWVMVTADGSVAGVGNSFGTFGPDGRLTSMTGFFETP